MSLTGNRSSRLYLSLQRPKRHKWNDNQNCKSPSGSELHQLLSPDGLQSSSLALPNKDSVVPKNPSVRKIGNYLILQQIDTNLMSLASYKAVNIQTQQEYVCKVTPIARYRDVLEPYLRAGHHDNINEIQEVVLGEFEAYFFFLENYGDLHTYVRNARRLREPVAAKFLHQIVSAVQHCHENGIVVRDLKLRKFVFKNPERTQLMLEGFEDSILLSETDGVDDDALTDKHGCPVYVSPEILQSTTDYSGRRADIWSVGVILYTMLIGCYPFHDTNINVLFSLIRQGHYNIPPTLSSSAKCLIRNILRMKPDERLSASEVLDHPWFEQCEMRSERFCRSETKEQEHQVPDTTTKSIGDAILFGKV